MATLIYMQHFVREEVEYPSLDEALDAAAFGSAYNTFAPDEIRDGDRVIAGKELDELVWGREKALGLA